MGNLLELHRKAKKEWEAKQPPPKPILRSLPLAKTCQYFGPQLTLAEVNEKKLAGCRQCNGGVSAYHCTFPGQKKFNDGAYTRGAECMSCTDWQPRTTHHEKPAPKAGISWPVNEPVEPFPEYPVGGDWLKSPNVWDIFSERVQHELTRPFAGNRGSGDGIVIAGGGKYFASTYCNIRLIRHLGCNLPIELWYLGSKNEMPEKWQKIVEPYNVTCIDADEVRTTHPIRILNGWELKFYAIYHSSFRKVLFLDADCMPLRNPTFVFNDPRFMGSGAVFQRDCKAFEYIKPSVLAMFKLPIEHTWDLESGVCLIDKHRWGKALQITVLLNSYSDLVYKVVYGDKTTPALASRLARQPYSIPSEPPDSGAKSWGLLQKWFDGSKLWMHLIHCKPTLDGSSFTSSQLKKPKWPFFANELNNYLNELRGIA